MRYYLAHDGGISHDSDYGNHLIVEKYKKGLQGGLGNLVSRITRSKLWNVQDSVEAGTSGDMIAPDEATEKLVERLVTVRALANTKMKELQPGEALKIIMDVVYHVSKQLSPGLLVADFCRPTGISKNVNHGL
jgi:methionyl-tRNA synthetase